MATNKIDILVYAHWAGMPEPKLIGTLSAHRGKGRKSFSFEYHSEWIKSKEQFLLDPDIGWYSGPQFPNGKENFGIFFDSMPDSWSSIRELQYAAEIFESDDNSAKIKKWMAILMAPGSSLGGARPKANIQDNDGHLWIAKFPSKNDTVDKALWEFLAYKLTVEAGIEMAESKIQKVTGNYHTFFTKRFDRKVDERIHFASAMTMTGNNEDIIKDNPPSYLELAEFIQFSGSDTEKDLHQLWRRIVFNIAISNTDDHLRNHGFILKKGGWRLSPAYDINPSVEKDGLAMNIDTNNNVLDFDLARSVGEYFQLTKRQMDDIIYEVKTVASKWKTLADEIGIPRPEQQIMEPAFR